MIQEKRLIGFLWRKKGDEKKYAWHFSPDIDDLDDPDCKRLYEMVRIYAFESSLFAISEQKGVNDK